MIADLDALLTALYSASFPRPDLKHECTFRPALGGLNVHSCFPGGPPADAELAGPAVAQVPLRLIGAPVKRFLTAYDHIRTARISPPKV